MATDVSELTAAEREGLEELERAIERFHRAHGALIDFHHEVGRAMDHFEAVVETLGASHPGLAKGIESDLLTAGVTADGKLTYQVVAEFEEGMLADVERLTDRGLDELVDGRRYALERAAERSDAP